MILAIDPGPRQSAYVLYDPLHAEIREHAILDNNQLITILSDYGDKTANTLVVEWVESFEIRAGSELFETVWWIGRLDERYGPMRRISRKQVKIHLLGTTRGGDPDVRAALVERFGPGKEKAIGTKKNPGPLFGIKTHEWSALAIAVCFSDGVYNN